MSATKKKSVTKKQSTVARKEEKTPVLASGRQLQTASVETSNQGSLSVELAEHLLGLSKEVVRREVTPSTVNAACNCAQQIHNLIRLNMIGQKYL